MLTRLSPRSSATLAPTPVKMDRLFPMLLNELGPLMWTPNDPSAGTGAAFSDVVWMYDDVMDAARPVTDAEKSAAILMGCQGGSPGPIHISWREADEDGLADPRLFHETIFTDVVTLADLIGVVAKVYEDEGRLPPAGMTLRWFMNDPLGRHVHIEFKSHAEVLREEAEVESLYNSDAVATVTAAGASSPLVPGGPATCC